MTKTSLFNYRLPKDRIAQSPVRPRDHSRLLVLERVSGTWSHHHFYELEQFLRSGDLLVVNESKVFKARLRGQRTTDDGRPPQDIEVFLLRPENDAGNWIALAKPGRKLAIGSVISFPDGRACTVLSKQDNGTIKADFHAPIEEIVAWTDRVGEIPTPPYVEKPPASSGDYQTVYAKTVGSVAAPTAGFHFTPELIQTLETRGVNFAAVTLHVGLGTFRPIKTETLEEHEMHEEWADIPEETAALIARTKSEGGRIIAVGTTTVRALESGIRHGMTRLFITPGYRFKIVDGLITNFHLPKSSLLVLVSAFAGQGHADPNRGRQIMLDAYHDAIEKGYRFYSFGDAMLIV